MFMTQGNSSIDGGGTAFGQGDSPQHLEHRPAIGRVGKAHGIQGQVGVEVRTDDPDGRFAVGTIIATDPPERGPLTVVGSRWHSGRLLVRFAGTDDRTGAEALRGTVLVVDVDEAERASESLLEVEESAAEPASA